MEAMLGISLYSYPYLKLAKTLCLFYYHLCFLFNKIGEPEGGKGSAWQLWGVGLAQIMYTLVSKCKNDKIKFKKNLKDPESNLEHKGQFRRYLNTSNYSTEPS
jgi:hypothetical protein